MKNPAHALTRALAVIGLGVFLGTATVRAAEILVNPGFETGALAPWFQDRDFDGTIDWNVTGADAHSGAFSATDNGNKEIRQNFLAVPTSDILEVSFWARHPGRGDPFIAVDFFYADNTDTLFTVATTSLDWEFFDVTSFLDPGKAFVAFSIFGNSTGVTLFDDARIRTAAVPEPGTIALLGAGLLGLLGCGRRRRKRAG